MDYIRVNFTYNCSKRVLLLHESCLIMVRFLLMMTVNVLSTIKAHMALARGC